MMGAHRCFLIFLSVSMLHAAALGASKDADFILRCEQNYRKIQENQRHPLSESLASKLGDLLKKESPKTRSEFVRRLGEVREFPEDERKGVLDTLIRGVEDLDGEALLAALRELKSPEDRLSFANLSFHKIRDPKASDLIQILEACKGAPEFARAGLVESNLKSISDFNGENLAKVLEEVRGGDAIGQLAYEGFGRIREPKSEDLYKVVQAMDPEWDKKKRLLWYYGPLIPGFRGPDLVRIMGVLQSREREVTAREGFRMIRSPRAMDLIQVLKALQGYQKPVAFQTLKKNLSRLPYLDAQTAFEMVEAITQPVARKDAIELLRARFEGADLQRFDELLHSLR